MNCPRCKLAMNVEEIRGQHYRLEIDCCPQCEGVWLDHDEMAKLERIVEPVNWEIRKIPGDIDQMAGLFCPRCDEAPLLIKADHHRDQKVIIDFCPNCNGTWLDKGELRAIQQENLFRSIFLFLQDLHH